MMLGYGGNCIRYGLGWGLGHPILPTVAILNWLWMVVVGTWAVLYMNPTTDRIDRVPEGSVSFPPDTYFGLGEVIMCRR